MVDLGYNYRLSDLQCALGLSQLQKLSIWVARRREIARRYAEAFSYAEEFKALSAGSDRESAYHLYVVCLNSACLSADRGRIFAALRAEGIGVNVHYLPVHLHPFYQERFGTRAGLCPRAEKAYESILSLPMFPAMSDDDVEDVIDGLWKVIDAYGIKGRSAAAAAAR
jgi:perosamine synthetase